MIGYAPSCRRCGSPVPDEGRYCPRCGSSIAGSATSWGRIAGAVALCSVSVLCLGVAGIFGLFGGCVLLFAPSSGGDVAQIVPLVLVPLVLGSLGLFGTIRLLR